MIIKKKFLLITVLISAALCLLLTSGEAAEVITMKLAHVCPDDHPYNTSAKRFAQLVKEKSNNTIEVNVFPAGALGGERDITENLQMGNIDLMWNSMGVTATFVPEVNVFNLPFIFKGRDNFIKIAEGPIGKKLLEKFDDAGLKGLAFGGPIFRVPMNNRGPINSPDDLKGLKIRLMEVPMHIATYKALKASPTPIPFPELYSSLQLGVVDANENALGTLSTAKLYEVQKYLTILPVFSNGAVLIMSKKTWDRLSAQQQKAVLDSVPETVKTLDRDYIKTGEDGLRIMEKHGIKVNTPPSLEPFVKAVEPVYAESIKKQPELKALIDEIRSVD